MKQTRSVSKRRGRRAAQTRRLYSFEVTRLSDRKLRRIRSIGALRAFARRIWEHENTKRREKMPEIVAGTGIKQGRVYLSYCEGRRRIVLARHERNRRILAHELVHALGYSTHGTGFCRRYFSIIRQFGGHLDAATSSALRVSPTSLR